MEKRRAVLYKGSDAVQISDENINDVVSMVIAPVVYRVLSCAGDNIKTLWNGDKISEILRTLSKQVRLRAKVTFRTSSFSFGYADSQVYRFYRYRLPT